jgi:HSP20 family protein
MDLMRFDPPLRGLERLSESLNRLFTTPFDRTPIEQSLTVAEWSPAVDIEETDKEYLVKVEIPEVKKEDVKVLVEEGTLTIRGERRQEKEEKKARYHRMERSYGTFFRSFTLPADADEKKVSAEFTDGMLKVHLLKSENAKPRTVEIKVN